MYICIYMYVRMYICMLCMLCYILFYVCMYVRTYLRMYVYVYVCMLASLALGQVLFTFGIQEFIRQKSVPGKSEYSSSKIRAPSNGPQNTAAIFLKVTKRF